jgi:decaprenylphospho-beta-D-ribofuranose 2-oxidase
LPEEHAQEQLLSGWGGTAPTRATVWAPGTVDAVVARVARPGARGVIARGLGRSYGDAAQNAGGRVLETNKLSGIVDFDMATGRVTALAGTSLEEIIGKFLPWGWFPSVVPGTKFVTVGGAIAADIHGKNHHVDGSFCDAVESFELWSPSGGISTVSTEQNADVFGATAGGMGLTGVITQATFRLRSVHTAFVRADTYRADDIDELMSLMESRDDRYSYSVAWLDAYASGKRLGRGIFAGANHAFDLDELAASPEARMCRRMMWTAPSRCARLRPTIRSRT